MLDKEKKSQLIIRMFLAALFLLCAVVQYNDPDPWKWILIYGCVAYAALAGSRLSKKFILLLLLVLAGYFVTYLPDVWQWIQDGMPSVVNEMKAENEYIELVREGGGLLLCILASSFLYKIHKG